MGLTITLPNSIEQQLAKTAAKQNRSVEDVAIALLEDALAAKQQGHLPEEVVAKIKALPSESHHIRPVRGSLAEALRAAPENPDFDLAAWQQAWAKVEAEMKTITRANDAVEGRG